MLQVCNSDGANASARFRAQFDPRANRWSRRKAKSANNQRYQEHWPNHEALEWNDCNRGKYKKGLWFCKTFLRDGAVAHLRAFTDFGLRSKTVLYGKTGRKSRNDCHLDSQFEYKIGCEQEDFY